MDNILESLTKLSELSNDELSELSDQIVTEFDSAASEEVSAEVVAKMTELANAVDTVKAELANREAQAQELSAQKEAAVSRVKGGGESLEATPDAETDSDKADELAVEETPAVTEEPQAPVVEDAEFSTATLEAPVAEAPVVEAPVAEVAPVEVVAEAVAEPEAEVTPEVPEATDEVVSSPDAETDSADEPSSTDEEASAETKPEAEEEAEEPTAVADVEETELSTRKDSEADMSVSENDQSPLQAPDSHLPVKEDAVNPDRATLTITAGGDIPNISNGSSLPDMKAVADAMTKRMHAIRRTTGGDGEQFSVATLNFEYPESRKLYSGEIESNNAKIEAVASPEAVVAAGGFCAPVETSYDIFGFGVTDRPVKDALASFSADRGGIRYTTSPVLGDLDGAVSTWTLQDDIDAATPGGPDPTKPCLRVDCGEEVVVHTDAIPLCLTFGNLQSRAFPELVERNNELALITHARYAEVRLLTRIGALSTQVTASGPLGVVRDFLVQVEEAAAGYRSRHRLSPSESLRVILPAWFKNAIRADLSMQMPGDGEQFTTGDNIIASWFNARHINVSWTLDGEALAGQGNQIFGAQNAGALNKFPNKVVWYLFSEGTFLFLDGGTLDLGLVRDSSLNATNDYKMFVETFEGVAKIGIESLRVVSNLEINGSATGLVDPATFTTA